MRSAPVPILQRPAAGALHALTDRQSQSALKTDNGGFRTRALLLLSLLLPRLAAADVDGGTPDAGSRWEDPLYAACPAAPPPERLDGGSLLLAPARVARVDCLMVTCDEDRRNRGKVIVEGAPPLSPIAWAMTALALTIGLGLGGWGGWELAKLLLQR